MFNRKKDYFKAKLDGVEKMIWDLEFKREKTLLIREEVRQEYDTTKQKKDLLEQQIKAHRENNTMEEGDIKKLEDNVVLLTRDVERYEAQMKGMDLDVFGSKPTQEYQDGVIGVNHQIDSLQELKGMLIQYIKKL